MLSFARNERGVRMASAAIILLPLASLICSMSKSYMLDLVVGLTWVVFASIALIAFLYERAEEEDGSNRQ